MNIFIQYLTIFFEIYVISVFLSGSGFVLKKKLVLGKYSFKKRCVSKLIFEKC